MWKLFTISYIDFQNFLYPESRGNIFPETLVPDSVASEATDDDPKVCLFVLRYWNSVEFSSFIFHKFRAVGPKIVNCSVIMHFLPTTEVTDLAF